MALNSKHPFTNKQGHILLSEPSELSGRSIVKNLKRADIIVDWRSSLEDSLRALESRPYRYHAVVVDTSHLRDSNHRSYPLLERAKDRGLPNIVLGSRHKVQLSPDLFNLGVKQYLSKPVQPSRLATFLIDLWENSDDLVVRCEQAFERRGLTAKEKEISRLIIKGLSNQEIAKGLGLTLGTVKFYTHEIFQKFVVSSRGEFFSEIFPT